MRPLDEAESSAGVLVDLHDQGVNWRLRLPDGYEGGHAELATSSSQAKPEATVSAGDWSEVEAGRTRCAMKDSDRMTPMDIDDTICCKTIKCVSSENFW